MLWPRIVLLGLETLEGISKPVSLLYDPDMLWDNAISLARSSASSHSSAEVLDGSSSIVVHEASNRVWAAQVVLKRMLENL